MNDDQTCRGSIALGSACLKCSRCQKSLNDLKAMNYLRLGLCCGVTYEGNGLWSPIPKEDNIKFKDPTTAILYSVNKVR